MFARKRSCVAIIATAALAAATLTFAAPASAAPYVPEVSVKPSHPRCAGQIVKRGTGFVPGSTVHLSLITPSHTFPLGTAVVNKHGRFTAHEKLPAGISGTAVNRAAGAPTSTNPNSAEVTIHIGACPVTEVVPPPPPPAAPPAFTGLDILGIIALVVVLLGAGGTLVYLGRRRKSLA